MKFKDLLLLVEDNGDDDVLAGMEHYEKFNSPVYVGGYLNCRGEIEIDFNIATIGEILDEIYESEESLDFYNQFSPEPLPDTKIEALNLLTRGDLLVYGGEEVMSHVSKNFNSVTKYMLLESDWDEEDLKYFEETVAEFKQQHNIP